MIALLSHEFCAEFEQLTGIKSYPLKPYSKLDLPVSSHADMLLCVIEKTIFCYEEYYNKNSEAFKAAEEYGYTVSFVSSKCEKNYPNDIALNVLIVGKIIVCNVKHTAKEIIDFAKKLNYKIINVKQGYSACSTAVLDENTVITSDKGIARELMLHGISVYTIDNEKIILRGYNCGFIGGASAVVDGNFIVFGDVSTFSSKNIIDEALKATKKELVFIPKNQITDFGGVKIFV